MPIAPRTVSPLFPDNILPDPPDIEAALIKLGQLVRERRPRVAEIKEMVAQHYNTTPLDLDGPLRNDNIALARHVFWYFARRFNGMSLTEIGRRCGGRDHTSVRYGVMKVERMLLHSPLFAEELNGLRLRLAERVLLRNGVTNANKDTN